MADVSHNVNIKITQSGAKELEKILNGISKAAKDAGDSVSSISKNIKPLTKNIEGLDSGVKKAVDGMKNMGSQGAPAVKKASNEIKEIGRTAKTSAVSVRGLLSSLKGFAAIAGITIGVRKAFEGLAQEQRSINQLKAAIVSTGKAAGRSLNQLTSAAQRLQSATTFSNEAIQEMQVQLLTFTKVTGDVFDKATTSVLDMATRMGTDATSAARILGRALNDPIRGLMLLRRQGVQFSESQEAVIKSLAETGRVAEAQRIILEKLQSVFGGSAVAATKGLSGAFSQLKNTLDDTLKEIANLITRTDNATEGMSSIEKVIRNVNDGLERFNGFIADMNVVLGPVIEKFDKINKVIKDYSPTNLLAGMTYDVMKANAEMTRLEKAFDKPELEYKKVADAIEEGNKVKVRSIELDMKMKEGTNELLTAFGLLNDKTSKFFTILTSVGKLIEGMGAGGGFSRLASSITGLFGFKNGGAFGCNGVQMMAKGGILNKPTCFGTSSGPAIAGEAGPEAVLPLTRGPGGKLGVQSAGGGGVNVQVIDQRSSGSPVSVEQNGDDVKILVRDEVRRTFSSGQMDGVMGQQFGLSRVGSFR